MPEFPNLPMGRVGRRDFLRLAGAGAGISALAACGVSGAAKAQPKGKALTNDVDAFWKGKKKTGEVNWAQWPLYIDVGKNKSDHPSIDAFTQQTHIKVHYDEVIQEDDTFFAKVQPSLSAGQYSGYDIATITNGVYFDKFRELGLFVPLEHSYPRTSRSTPVRRTRRLPTIRAISTACRGSQESRASPSTPPRCRSR
jgi:spermidine/putrescine transport system substrate-binding protein